MLGNGHNVACFIMVDMFLPFDFPEYSREPNGEVCINARLVLEKIRLSFPNETHQSLANRARVHTQTIQRWNVKNRAEAIAIRRLINSLNDEKGLDGVLLKEATPAQLKMICQEIGWDKIINA